MTARSPSAGIVIDAVARVAEPVSRRVDAPRGDSSTVPRQLALAEPRQATRTSTFPLAFSSALPANGANSRRPLATCRGAAAAAAARIHTETSPASRTSPHVTMPRTPRIRPLCITRRIMPTRSSASKVSWRHERRRQQPRRRCVVVWHPGVKEMSRIRIVCSTAFVVSALCLTGLFLGANAGASRFRPDPRAASIATSMRQLLRSSSLNSMVYGVWINGRPLATGALGSALTGVPATQNMHFRVGNVMESMDGTLFLRYVDQHKVSLNAPVSRWFPRLPHARQVTLRMLATNTSGYQDYVTTKSFEDAFAANPYRNYSTMAMIRLGTDLPLLFTPGKSWAFSDTNYLLLGLILGKIAHKPLATAIQQQIFRPLGMTQTGMPRNANASMPAPVMHAYTTERGPYEDSTFWTPSPFATNGSVYSTVTDLGRWGKALGTGSLLSQASHKLQLGPSTVGLGPLKPNKYYGYGEIVTNRWIITNPQVYGYNGDVSYFPNQKIAVVVFCTYGPKSVLSKQNGTAALLRIAHILTPNSIPAISSGGRVS